MIPSGLCRDRRHGTALHRALVQVEIKAGADSVRIPQYPMPLEAKRAIAPHIQKLLRFEVLKPIPVYLEHTLLPVKQPHTNDYSPVHDLRSVNKRVMDIPYCP